MVNAPRLVRFDLSTVKRVKIHGSVDFEFRAEMLNAFNSPYFNIGIDRRPAARDDDDVLRSRPGRYANFNNGSHPVVNAVAGSSVGQLPPDRLLGDNTGAHHSADLARALVATCRVRGSGFRVQAMNRDPEPSTRTLNPNRRKPVQYIPRYRSISHGETCLM